MEFHLSFNPQDPFELALYRAIKTLPRGYGKLFFMRTASLIFQDERSVKRLARTMYDFGRDVRPTCLTVLPKVEYKEGEPSVMLMYYPPSVEKNISHKCYRSPAAKTEVTQARLRAINEMEKDEPPKMKRVPKKTKPVVQSESCATGARARVDKPAKPKKAKVVKPKRPRGRPRKHPKVDEPAAAKKKDETPDNVHDLDERRRALKRLCWG